MSAIMGNEPWVTPIEDGSWLGDDDHWPSATAPASITIEAEGPIDPEVFEVMTGGRIGNYGPQVPPAEIVVTVQADEYAEGWKIAESGLVDRHSMLVLNHQRLILVPPGKAHFLKVFLEAREDARRIVEASGPWYTPYAEVRAREQRERFTRGVEEFGNIKFDVDTSAFRSALEEMRKFIPFVAGGGNFFIIKPAEPDWSST